jgi:hypothetical protein
MPAVTLYARQRSIGDAPTHDGVESAHVAALLLTSSVEHRVERCATAASSPSGALPCVEIDGDVDGDAQFDGRAPRSAREAAHRCATATKRRAKDCDADVNADERAMIAGLNALVRENLRIASDYFTHVDEVGYEARKRELGKTLPWPVNAWTARARANEAKRELERAGVDGERACAMAVEAYGALNNRLVNSSAKRGGGEDGHWLCGKKPRSCDAAAYAQLSYHARSPSCEALRAEMKRYPRLIQYVNDVSERLAEMEQTLVKNVDEADPAAATAATVDPSAWGDRYDSNHAERRTGWKPRTTKTKNVSEKDKDMRRKAWYSVGFAAASVISYMFLGGVIQLDFGEEEEDDAADDVDDDE